MTDRLAALLDHFSVEARVFNTGPLCGINIVGGDSDAGQLHLVRDGHVEVHNGDGSRCSVGQPSLLLYPRPLQHRFITDPARGADFCCADVRFGDGAVNPITSALPAFICLPLSQLLGADEILNALFNEAFRQDCGRQAVLNRLFEVVLIQVLRALMEQGAQPIGMLAGLAHPRLRHALVAMHEAPAQDWPLDALAEAAGMSRSVFARSFRDTVGHTPGAYLQGWRVALVQQALRQGRPLKWVVNKVGYGSEAALSRTFKAQTGQSPRQWRQALLQAPEPGR